MGILQKKYKNILDLKNSLNPKIVQFSRSSERSLRSKTVIESNKIILCLKFEENDKLSWS